MRHFYVVLLIICGILISGCMWNGKSGRRIDDAAVSKIERGKTTKAQVIELMGKPQSQTTDQNGETWTYQYYDSGVVNYGLPMQTGHNELDMVNITFDGDVVRDFTQRKTQSNQ